MIAVKTENSNHNFGPPKGREDDIVDLPCQIVEDDPIFKGRVIWSTWVPNQEERDAIARGWNVQLGVGWIGGFPPVLIRTTHEKAIDDAG